MSELKLAHPFVRFLAYTIDSILLYILLFLFIAVSGASVFFVTFFDIFIKCFYFGYMNSSAVGSTIGQRLFGLRVVGNDGNLLSLSNSLNRIFAQIFIPIIMIILSQLSVVLDFQNSAILLFAQVLLFVFLVFLYVFALFSGKKLTVFDIVSSSKVVEYVSIFSR